MALSVFDDKDHQPDHDDVQSMLGRSAKLWSSLIAEITAAHAPIAEAWNFSGAKFGWSLRLKQKERTLLYLIPQESGFLAAVVLGRRAVSEAEDSELPAAVLQMIHEAREDAESGSPSNERATLR